MQYPIQVPNPCHEAWNDMMPNGNGRHCDKCAKTVVDFTSWDVPAIQEYLQAQGNNRTCGRFKTEQLAAMRDNDTFIQSLAHAHMPVYKKIAAILLLAFGLIQMSCNTDTHQPPTPPITGAIAVPPPPPVDTTTKYTYTYTTLGEPIAAPPPQKKKTHKPVVQTMEAHEDYITGVPMDMPPASSMPDTTKK